MCLKKDLVVCCATAWGIVNRRVGPQHRILHNHYISVLTVFDERLHIVSWRGMIKVIRKNPCRSRACRGFFFWLLLNLCYYFSMQKIPLVMIGSFILDEQDYLYLRTKPNKDTGYRCLNEQLFEGQEIEEVLKKSVKAATNLEIQKYELLHVSQGHSVPLNGETYDMVFVDHLVRVSGKENFKGDESRKDKWQEVDEWLQMDEKEFGPYIKNVIGIVKSKLN
jgi:hypothetical protein